MITLSGVTKVCPRRGQEPVVALDDISLEIPIRDIHGIVGESGAGKSTLIRCLTVLEQPTKGVIHIGGLDLASVSSGQLREVRQTIGMIFQGANLLDVRTMRGNIAIPLRLAGIPSSRRTKCVSELLDLIGLSDRGTSYPFELSDGQRQRVGIARALADNPSVLLCDEPASALDAETTEQILGPLKSIRDRHGATVIIITHEISVVCQICNSITLLDSGRITANGRVENVVAGVEPALSRQVVLPPLLAPEDAYGRIIVDVAFTSQPGEPTGARVLDAARELGVNIDAGASETIDSMQVARLALTVGPDDIARVRSTFADIDIATEVRARTTARGSTTQ